MTTQITVRLPDDVVEFVDNEAGGASRASVVTEALVELRRHRIAERDAAILRATGDYPDLDGLGAFGLVGLDDL